MSLASLPLTSPTMMRSGRIRRAFLTRSASVISSSLSSREQLSSRNVFNSSVSSITTTRSVSGIRLNSAFKRVVLPTPGPPAIMIFAGRIDIPSTYSHNWAATSWLRVPCRTRSKMLNGETLALVIVICGPKGERAMFTRPSRLGSSTLTILSRLLRPAKSRILRIKRSNSLERVNCLSVAMNPFWL